MKPLMLAIAAILTISTAVKAQTTELLSTDLPTTKEEFIASEPRLLNTINYLETTPIGDPWRAQAATLIAWITNSPTVTVEMNDQVMPFVKTKKNPELIAIFMGGYTRWVVQNNYSRDITQGSLAGITSVIKVYKAGGFKKDKEMDKLVEIEAKGGLSEWVTTRMAKK